jgi:hypothetical protein
VYSILKISAHKSERRSPRSSTYTNSWSCPST